MTHRRFPPVDKAWRDFLIANLHVAVWDDVLIVTSAAVELCGYVLQATQLSGPARQEHFA